MEATTYILIGMIILFSAMLQAAIGFGFALIAVPLFVWAGVPIPQAVAMTGISSFVQMSLNTWNLRQQVQWRAALLPMALRFSFLPVGTWLMTLLVSLGVDHVKQMVGAVLLLVLSMQWLLRFEPREKVGVLGSTVSGASSGVLMGVSGMGGPPIVLWVMAHRWTSQQQRGTMFFSLGSGSPVNVLLLWMVFGEPVAHAIVLAVAYIPLMVLGASVGVRLGNRLSTRHFRLMATGMLVVLALASIVTPLVRG